MSTHTTMPDLKLVPIGDIRESLTNPRKHFHPVKLNELADSIRTQGIRQPLLLRPKAGDTPMELVAGARRYRAAKLAGLDAVPALVAEMSDREAIEVQVVENLQRDDLTEIEEAESYQAMLSIEENGVRCYTVPLLAERFGVERSTIYRRLKLLDLPAVGRAALESGELGARQAVLIARIPDPEAREQALQKVLAPQLRKEALSYKETDELIGREFMLGLKGAPFKLDDAKLLPEAGACSACPKMTDNCTHLFSAEEAEQFKKRKVCTDPSCFRRKLDAMWQVRLAQAEADGKTVLSEAESRKVFPSHAAAGHLQWDSSYVLLNEKPAPDLLKPEVVETVGTWRTLLDAAEKATAAKALEAAQEKIEQDPDLSDAQKKDALAKLAKNVPGGGKVPRVLARDQAGAARELVDRRLAIEAIELSGEPLFLVKTGRVSSGSDDFAKARKAELEAAKIRTAETIEGMRQMHAALVAKWEPSPIWDAVFPLAIGHAGADGLWLVAKWQGLKFGDHGTNKEETIEAWANGLPAAERQALVPLLLLGQQMKFSGLTSDFENLSKEAKLGVEIKAIERAVKDQMKAAAAEKKAAAKAPKAAKKTKAEKHAEADAAAAAPYGWDQATGRAAKPDVEMPMGEMPEGTKCEVLLALAPDGKWRYGLELESRMSGKESRKGLPALKGPSFGGGSGWDEALMAGFTEALAFFKDDPAAFRVVADEADPDVAAAFEGEGGAAPVADKRAKKTRGQITDEVKKEVGHLVAEGLSSHEIAKRCCISVPSVQNIKRELGLLKPAAAGEKPPAPAATPAFEDRNSGRTVDFPSKEDAQAWLEEQRARPGFAAYRTRIEKQKTTWDLVWEKIVQAPPVNFAVGVAAPEVRSIYNPARLAEWVKASSNGMSIAEIARSYGATEEDVEGALETARVTPPAAKPVALACEFAAGDEVEWDAGPGKPAHRGVIIAIAEWQKRTGFKWEASWIGRCRAVDVPKAKFSGDRFRVVEGTSLRLVSTAKADAS